jgi:hypothetical protein
MKLYRERESSDERRKRGRIAKPGKTGCCMQRIFINAKEPTGINKFSGTVYK